jgi:NTP pyrophosphatase (non-canonical NTP hydrolase)
LKYSLENELADLVRDIYHSTKMNDEESQKQLEKLEKEEILKNIRRNIEKYAREYKFGL